MLPAFLLIAILAVASGPLPADALQPPQDPAEAEAAEAAPPTAASVGDPPEDAAGDADAPGDADAAADADAPDDGEVPADAEAAGVDADSEDAADTEDTEDAEPPAGTFEAPAGLILSYVKADGREDFERVLARIGEALAQSEDEAQRELVRGWRLYRAREPGPEGEVLYVWLVDPAIAGADYGAPALLGAAVPNESQQLFDAFSETFGSGQALVNLEPISVDGVAVEGPEEEEGAAAGDAPPDENAPPPNEAAPPPQ